MIDSYAAGLIDGDGYLGIKKNNTNSKSYYSEIIQVKMMDKQPLDFLKLNYGGVVKKVIKENYHMWTFIIKTKNANDMIKRIYPYLIIKKHNAECCFKLRESIEKMRFNNGNEMPKDEIKIRNDLWLKVKQFNKRHWIDKCIKNGEIDLNGLRHGNTTNN